MGDFIQEGEAAHEKRAVQSSSMFRNSSILFSIPPQSPIKAFQQ